VEHAIVSNLQSKLALRILREKVFRRYVIVEIAVDILGKGFGFSRKSEPYCALNSVIAIV
jgi:hypothetical protein